MHWVYKYNRFRFTFSNVDETLLSNKKKVQLLLGSKGRHNYYSNINFKESASFVGAITNKGDWYFANLIERNWSGVFIKLIENPVKWIKEELDIETKRILLLLDSSLIQTSNE